MDDENILKFGYNEKIEILENISREIRKKRFILDDSRENFGFDKMSLLSKVLNLDEVKGYPMVASKVTSKILNGVKVGVKVVPIETKYPKDEHPSSLEIIALKELTKEVVCKNVSPHIAYYLGSQKVPNKCKALKFLNLKRLEVEELVRTHSNMLISEFIEGNSLDTWVYNIYENDQKISDEEWRILVFQLVYTLAVIQKKYRLMHNDMHYGNILIDTSLKKDPGQYFVYTINDKKYYLRNVGFISKLWDWEFAMSYNDKIPDFYPNKFIIGKYSYDRKKFVTKQVELDTDDSTEFNVPYNYNEIYDLHYFLVSLLDLYISQELFDWIVSIYPDELIPREDDSSEGSSHSSYSSSLKNGSEIKELEEIDEEAVLKKKLAKLNLNKNSENESKHEKSEDMSEQNSTNSSRSDNSDDSESESCSSDEIYDRYLSSGRIRNGIDEEFEDLPIPIKLLHSDFFEKFTKKPADFDESKAIYFDAGF